MRYRKLLYNINDLLLKIRNLHVIAALFLHSDFIRNYFCNPVIELSIYMDFMKSFFLIVHHLGLYGQY